MPGSRRCFLIALGALLLAVGAAADARAAMVTVSVDGPGSVRVRASEPGAPVLDAVCATSSSTPALRGGRTCYFHVFPGLGAAIDVRLDAEPLGDQGQRFLRWAPPECSGTDPSCTYALPRSDQSMRVRALFTDVQAPTVTIRSPPADDQLFVSEDGSFAGAVGSSDPDAPPQCDIDGVPAPDCAAVGLSDHVRTGASPHILRAWARDPSGNQRSVERSFRVLIPPRMTSIGRQPTGAVTNAREVRLALASTKDGSFRCELTRGAVLVIDDECDPNRRFSTAEEGEYVLRVRARVALPSEGEFEGPWAVDAFRVDHTPPETELVAGIEELGLTNRTQEQFRLAGGDAYECALDGAAFTPCGPEVVLTGLGVGPHRLTARALDAAGNADPTPVTRTWRVTADLDGDGHVLPADCQDADPAIHPGAREIYDNAVDEDCDGRAAEDPDRDRDGQVRPVDCNDRDARIGPGQPEQPGNRVDEDCDGVVERFPSLGSRVNFSFELRSGGRTRITALYVSQAVRGSTIRVSCRTPRRACAVRGRVEVRRNTRRLDLLRRLERRTLRARAVIVVTVTKPGHRGTVTRLVMRGGRSPRRVERCTSPGSSRRLRC